MSNESVELPVILKKVDSISGSDGNIYLKQVSTVKKQSDRIIISLKLFLTEDLKVATLYNKDKKNNFEVLNNSMPDVLRYPYSKAEDIMYYIEALGVISTKTKNFELQNEDFRAVLFNGTKVLFIDYNELLKEASIPKEVFIKTVLRNIKKVLLLSNNTMSFCKELEKERDYNSFIGGNQT